MRRILRTGICLFGLSAVFVACGQGEGERCQVDSDCASGLSCKDVASGNGICKSGSATTADAAAANADAASDAPISTELDGSNSVDTNGVDSEGASAAQIDAGGID